MTIATHRRTLGEFLADSGASWSESDIVASMEILIGPKVQPNTVTLPKREQELWAKYSGITPSTEASAASERRTLSETALQSVMAFTGDEVSSRLRLKPSTVRHYRLENRLYSYLADGKSRFPSWQFSSDGSSVLPGLPEVLAALDSALHPRTVMGFFSTPQSELVIDHVSVTPRDWLLGGGDPREVAVLASEVGLGM
ncbi:hypothetical protein [Subtercola frigoramans]|uniref:DNA-binding protein n=1 Tax=Subtercola frigoramans TaxID=120298 RepID=A0ABS2L6P0_9MICO|nr:hypothetical protein [Subtercola frigoramans]MBM7472742.1 hypothetical protein [Subtercola frigoramans]